MTGIDPSSDPEPNFGPVPKYFPSTDQTQDMDIDPPPVRSKEMKMPCTRSRSRSVSLQHQNHPYSSTRMDPTKYPPEIRHTSAHGQDVWPSQTKLLSHTTAGDIMGHSNASTKMDPFRYTPENWSIPARHQDVGSEQTKLSPYTMACETMGPSNTGPPAELPQYRLPIKFYHKHKPYYGFTNFSSHAVNYNMKAYPTSEHLFQSFKFVHKPDLAEHIRTCSSRPSVALAEARRFQPEVRSDWDEISIQKMEVALWHKFDQHQSLKDELLSTGDADLIEDSDIDGFWGVGKDRKGRNELGKALERLRRQLRA